MWKGAHGVPLAITEGHQAESGLVSMGPVAGGWPGASDPLGSRQGRWGALNGEQGALGLLQASRAGWSPGVVVVHRPEGLSSAGKSGECTCRPTEAPRRPPPGSPLVKGFARQRLGTLARSPLRGSPRFS